jgi:hypothetical protein
VLALGPAIVVLILGVITFDGIRRGRESRALVTHSRDVIERAQSTLSALQDAETGERGFIITGEPRYLEPYDNGVKALATDTTGLRALTRDNPAQQKRIDSLDVLCDARVPETSTAGCREWTRRAPSCGPAGKLSDAIRVSFGRSPSTTNARCAGHAERPKPTTRASSCSSSELGRWRASPLH